MATRRNSTTFPWFILVVLAILAVGSGGAFRNVAVVVGIVVVFVWLSNVSAAARRAAGQPASGGGFVGRRQPPDLPPEVAARFQRLAGEMVVPGGRSMDEVMREAAEVYAQLPPHLREEIDRSAPDFAAERHVEVSGPLGNVVARAMGIQPGQQGPSEAPAPPSAAPASPTPAPAAPSTPGAASTPTAPQAPPEAAPTGPPVAPVTITPAAITPAPITLAPITLAPITPSAPVGAPAVREDLDVRSGATAPDVLTGSESPPTGTLAEGWYVTADGRRERWWNGASWTAHVRERGAEG